MLITISFYRSANLLSAVKSSRKVKARSHTPKPPRSNVSLLLNVSSTSVTDWRLNADSQSASKMPL